MLGFVGVIASDCSVAAVTVSVVVPDFPPKVAVISDVPVPTPVASPPLAEIVATVAVAEAHVTLPVRSRTVLSEYVPVALNCWVEPFVMVGFVGVTAIELNVAALTTSVVVPFIVPTAAVITVVPTDTAVAWAPGVIVATPVLTELQVAVAVMSWVVPSEKVPVAVNCCVPATARRGGGAGVTAIDCNAAAVTVTVVFPVTPPTPAVITDVPAASALVSPVAVTLAVAGVAEAQVALPVRSTDVPSEYVPVAFSCCVWPFDKVGFAGVIAMDVSVAVLT
jgi:hypothetical protein